MVQVGVNSEVFSEVKSTSFRGTLISLRYPLKTLGPSDGLFIGAFGTQFILMDDNSHPPDSFDRRIYRDYEYSEYQWPAGSSDLNLLQHAWNALGRAFAAQLLFPEHSTGY
ncbi:hypothetical protein TNCV_741411 [Trichonephila clavipes]|nr:hypothetical protein TNCV_741411 [Trichonephila clavipes]